MGSASRGRELLEAMAVLRDSLVVAGSHTVQLEDLQGAKHVDLRTEAADEEQKELGFLDRHLKRA